VIDVNVVKQKVNKMTGIDIIDEISKFRIKQLQERMFSCDCKCNYNKNRCFECSLDIQEIIILEKPEERH
jgi:hypothetical protein